LSGHRCWTAAATTIFGSTAKYDVFGQEESRSQRSFWSFFVLLAVVVLLLDLLHFIQFYVDDDDNDSLLDTDRGKKVSRCAASLFKMQTRKLRSF